MANKIMLTKIGGGLAPVDLESARLFDTIASGDVIEVPYTTKRNPRFHRKFFALLRVGFDLWEPQPSEGQAELFEKYGPPEKNPERYREDITILAGFYDCVYDLNGIMHLKAKSISFANMTEDEFGDLFDKVLSVILRHVPDTYSDMDIQAAVDRIMAFT